jgi:chemotaxis protein methyltransferase CheR
MVVQEGIVRHPPPPPPRAGKDDVEDIEVRLLLEGIFRRYGYDFRDYAWASLKRRVLHRTRDEGLLSVSALQERVLRDRLVFERLMGALTVNVSSMFRDPAFFGAFRERVVPLLRTYPFLRIWHAGCASGEEVYSMAILLEEEGLYDRCRIYATDVNESSLAYAKAGIYSLSTMQEYTSNYIRAGGTRAFSDYYTANYDHAIFRPSLRERIVFCQHNLATDGGFNEFHVILCRNVMIYFNRTLQARVHDLFHESLCHFGVLSLGAKESLKFSPREESYEALDEKQRIYRRIR